MALVHINWKPSAKDLRLFGAVILVGFVMIGMLKYFWPWSWLLTQNKRVGLILVLIGWVVGGLGLTGTRLALPAYWLWMGVAFVLGNIMNRVILGVVFFGVFTPLGWLARLTGRDRLELKKPDEQSYWKDLTTKKDVSDFERQF